MLILEHLTIIWVGVLIAHYLAKLTRLTPVLFYLFMGAVYVNVGLLPEVPAEFITGFAEVGIILIMFALGFEENVGNFMSGVKRSWGIAFFGGLTPFLTAYFVAMFLWNDVNIALVVGLAMTATAVSLTLVSLKSEGLNKSRAATGIMTAAVLDDVASLALVAVIIPIATGASGVDILSIAIIIGKALGFFVVVGVLSSWVLPTEARGPLHLIPGLGRFGIAHIFSLSRGQRTLVVLIYVMLIAMASHAMGLHPAVGAYMAGLILREEYFNRVPKSGDGEDEEDYEGTKRLIDNVAFVWIGPVFFVDLGAKIIFDADLIVSILPHFALLTICLMVGQIASASLAARYTGGFNFAESVMIGLGMLGRAELAFVVLNIAYVQNKVLTDEAFYTLMLTAFALNVAVPICIKLWKPTFVKTAQLD